ncbi:MAG: hypothetical protein LBD42_03650 [Desulfovibrio sp.]|nr:hypothetical protein [Desulfovibrio sp.]
MPLLENLQQFDVTPSEFFITLGFLCLLLFLQAAALGAPMLATATETLFVARRKTFYDKCAMQIAQLACLLAIVSLAITGIFLFLCFRQPPSNAFPWAALPLCLVCLLIPLLPGLYLSSWNMLKTRRTPHITLGMTAVALSFASLLACLLLLDMLQDPPFNFLSSRNELLDALQEDPLVVLQARLLFYLDMPIFWPLLACIATFGLAAASSLLQLWLFFRRKNADYGRDYYAFAIQYCARAAISFTMLASIITCGIFLFLRNTLPPEFCQPPDPGILIVAAGLPLSCCLIWLCLVKSEFPLRHKPGAVFACVFLLVALYANMLLFGNSFPAL